MKCGSESVTAMFAKVIDSNAGPAAKFREGVRGQPSTALALRAAYFQTGS